jgi:hypothetical protein
VAAAQVVGYDAIGVEIDETYFIQAREHIPRLATLYPDFRGGCLDWKPPASISSPDVAPALSQTYPLFAPAG